MVITLVRASLFLLLTSPLVTVSAADVYPSKPIRIIVPYAPGGNADITARTIAPGLTEMLGQSIFVDNRAGANGAIGTALAARAAPDGLTLLLGTSGSMTNGPALELKLGYDPVKDFAPISMISVVSMVIVVHPSVPARNIKDLIAVARARPDRMTFGSSGVGSSDHLAGELFQSMTGISLIHVVYKGGGPALIDLLGGQVDVLFNQISSSINYIQSGKLRPLAVSTLKRSPLLPDVPTADESGVKGFDAITFSGLLAPSSTPRDVLTKLHEELTKVLRLNSTRESFNRLGAEVLVTTPEQFSRFIREDLEKWTKLVRTVGIKKE